MRHLLILLCFCFTLTVSGTTYYIDPSGSNSNSGSSSSPWQTLSYACSKVTTSGDIIYVNSGTYNETSRCILAPGVSITGQGATSVIKSSYTGSMTSGIIDVSSGSGTPVNGNQSISFIELDGNSQSNLCAISSSYRSNVTISNCTILNFADRGISIQNGGDFMGAPSYFSNNNQVHDCIISNCGHEDGSFSEYADVWWYGQTSFLLYNNTMNNTAQSVGNADNMKCAWTTNSKIYNNTFTKPNGDNGGEWNFYSELFFTTGGMEIYNNTMNGNACLDVVDVRPGSQGYGIKIYNNLFSLPSPAAATTHGMMSIDFEEWGAVQQVYIYGNHFKNTNTAVQFDMVGGTVISGVTLNLIGGNVACDHIYIYSNLFENIGNTTNSYAPCVDLKPEGATNIAWDQIYIDNNTMISGGSMYAGILCETGGTMTNLYFRNNIIRGAASYPVYFSHSLSGSVATVYSQKNLYYQNATNAIGYSGVTVSGLTEAAVSSANPLFVSSTDFHLQPSSPAIGAGIPITTPSISADCEGSPINNPPDIGAYKSGTSVTQPVTPVYQSSAVANATPSLLEMTYDQSLNSSIIPAASSFSVLINSIARPVSTITISGVKVQLTLASPVVFGDAITVSYNKPSSNPLQTLSGGQASTISSKPVTNNVSAINPVYVSSAIANSTPAILEMTYNLTLANIVPPASAFSVLINSIARTVNSVVVSGTRVQLTLASPVVFGDVITVSYSKPTANPLQATSGAQAATTGNLSVTNNVNALNPVYVSSAVANATPNLLELTYNMNLANIVPPVSSFAVQVNSTARAVNAVAINGTKVQLTLASRILPGDVVTVSYIKPSANPLQTASAVLAASISNQQVVNNCINIAPAAIIISPSSSSSFTSPANIAITANASDADGSVSKVEFYNGSTILGSVSTPPYLFTWNNVAAGNYSLTCIATDNLGAKTTSSVISVSVTDKTPARNKRPFVKISNPLKGNSFDNLSSIEIEAVASDTDGTVSKVAFYNGDTQLVELTSAPYTYTWKDVPAGTYTITAVATDNMSDTTHSSPVDFVVGNTVKYDPKSEIFNLYPNPNDGHFSIEFVNPLQSERDEIIISDLTGKKVYSGYIMKEDIMKQFDISNIRSGMYVMLIKDKEILVTKKFIKQ